MKKLLLLTLMMATPVAFWANEPYQRTSAGVFRQINEQGHLQTSGRKSLQTVNAISKVAQEAPANALEVPVKHSLGKNEPDNIALYTTIDANNDGKTWSVGGMSTYSVCLTSSDAVIEGSDDWMVTPPVHLKADVEYTFSFEEGCATAKSPGGKLEVKFGQEPTVAALTNVIFSDTEHLLNSASFAENSNNFTVSEEGYYYFGFHAYSPKGSSAKICNLSITETAAKVDPPMAGTLSYVLAPMGELKATVTYVAPTLSMGGETLAAISKVEVSVNYGAVTKEFTDVTPGATLEFETEMWNSANNKIEVIAYMGDTAGEAAVLSGIYCGPDNPKPLTNVQVSLSDDYRSVTVSWDPADAVGENGGYVDVENITYYIFDAYGSYYDPALVETKQTSYTFDYSDLEKQDFVAYQVTAGFGENFYSLATNSPIVLAGPAETLPFAESFANALFEQDWALDAQTTSQGWYALTVKDNDLQTNMDDEQAEPIYLNSQDGDNGFFMLMPIQADAIYGFESGKIDISTAANPVVEFWAQGKGSNIEVRIANEGGEFEVLRTVKFKQEPTEDWTLYRVDLKDYKSARYIRLAFRFVAVDNTETETWSVPFDNIRVRDLVDTDLRIFAPAVISPDKVGNDATVTARVENLGTKECAGASIELYEDGKLLEKKELETLAANAITVVSFLVPTNALSPESAELKMKVVCADDAVQSNNEVSAVLKVKMLSYPLVTELKATVENDAVTLSWDAPDISDRSPVSITEDFEDSSYPVMSIDGFCDWTFYDGDGVKTYNILQETNNPYQTQPQAFQLFNPIEAGVPESSLIDAQAHSGNQFLVAWSAGKALNDNWLISPALSGEEQTISFYAKSFSLAWPESFEVLYSTTDKNPENFVKIEAVENYPETDIVPEVWTEFKAVLPAGAKYFAIHHNSYDSGALYVDDISFMGASVIPDDLTVLGYNVYRDGEKINNEAVASAQMVDDVLSGDEPSGDYTFAYQVSVVYNYGESQACEALEVTVVHSSVESVLLDKNADARYYDLQGLPVAARSLTEGFYIRISGGKAEKVLLK